VLSIEEAGALARQWADARAAGPVDVTLWDFELGWVAFATPTGAPNAPAVGGKAVIDRETGDLTTFPAIPVEEVAAEYRRQHLEPVSPAVTLVEPISPVAPGPPAVPAVLSGHRALRRIDLAYRLISTSGAASAQTLPKTWFFDVPVERDHRNWWGELLHRIFFDANVKLRERDPDDSSWLAMDSFEILPVSVAELFTWTGARDLDSVAGTVPMLVAAGNVDWEWSGNYFVDDTGMYDGMAGEDFAELVAYRALMDGNATEARVLDFLERLYPGRGAEVFADRDARYANLTLIRPTDHFRKLPGAEPWASGPP
jgi:hypothetical protein